MIAVVVDEENFNRHLCAGDGLQFLQVHHNAAVAGQEDNVALVALTILVRLGRADGRRKIVAHRSDCGIRDEALPLLNPIGMAADHAGGAVSDHSNRVFRHRIAEFPNQRVDIRRARSRDR